MILSDLILANRSNQNWKYSGMDHIDKCLNKLHFASYPYKITYDYNSRGFRDQEWPESVTELKNAIWCIGDSFTVGLGSPLAHTWPTRLATVSNQQIINVSMDGASNEWMARTAEKIIEAVNPKNLVIMWSYTHRRENNNTLLDDEDRRMHSEPSSVDDDWENFLHCKKRIDSIFNTPIHFAIPDFHFEILKVSVCWEKIRGNDWPATPPTTPAELNELPYWILTEINSLHNCLDKIQNSLHFQNILKTQHQVIPIESKDLARDGHHFDWLTADWVAMQAANYLN